MRDELKKIIIRQFQKEQGRLLQHKDISFLLYASRSCDILFCFINSAKTPRYLFKITANKDLFSFLKTEQSILGELSECDFPSISETFPRVLGQGMVQNHYFILETAGQGEHLINHICACKNSLEQKKMIFYKITDWLIELHKQTTLNPKDSREGLLEENFKETLALYKKKHGLGQAKEEKIISSHNQVSSLYPASAFILQHRDFSPWNILYNRKKGDIFVFDWEYGAFQGLPLIDLLNFAIDFKGIISAQDKAQKITSKFSLSINVNISYAGKDDFLDAFYNKNQYSLLLSGCVSKYCQEFNLSSKSSEYLFLLFILRHLYREGCFLDLFLEKGCPFIFK
ncbi:MAG: phosphotransferase [Candidatus Omnitrophica bacterium]|nr:phosphotransferase [Candidatus Omnitrophota bacterium]